ncbi:UNVERIFIED_CONTAM: hypothetical protein FKN15_078448 [Acipenser sinensis]
MLLLPCSLAALLLVLAPLCSGLNLDVETPTLFSGPNGSYFGFSVEFYLPGSSSPASQLSGTSTVLQLAMRPPLPSTTPEPSSYQATPAHAAYTLWF